MISGCSFASATSLLLSRLDPRQVDELGQSAGEGGRVEPELLEVLLREAGPGEGAREVLVVGELEFLELAVLLCGRGARRGVRSWTSRRLLPLLRPRGAAEGKPRRESWRECSWLCRRSSDTLDSPCFGLGDSQYEAGTVPEMRPVTYSRAGQPRCSRGAAEGQPRGSRGAR